MSSVAGPTRLSRLSWAYSAKNRELTRTKPALPAVLIATADPHLLARWKGVLQEEYPVREVSERECLQRTLGSLPVDVLLLDLELLALDGIGDGPIIRDFSKDAKVVLLSCSPNEREGIRVLKAGARGYCNRNIDPQVLRKIVDRVHDGELWAERKLIPRLLEEFSAHPDQRPEVLPKSDGRLSLLTPREREIAFLIAVGASNKQIASRLRVGEGTVKAHLTAIFRKLGFSDRLQLGLFLVSPHAGLKSPAGVY